MISALRWFAFASVLPPPTTSTRERVGGTAGISAVPRIARICALGLVFDELLDEVCREILALSGADGGCLFLTPRDERSERFSPAAESGRQATSVTGPS